MNGLLVLDKPGGMTSRDALNRVKRWFPRRTKIGHTGTLDPLATGVLVVCLGSATRLADYVQAMGKSYDSRFRLGATSTTDDADGEVTATESAIPPTREAIDAALAAFIGLIMQFPPSFSALMVDGQRAHELARKGSEVPLASRPVTIHAIHVRGYDWPFLDVSIDCGKGTYIRSIARDLGAKLGVGGMVETLRRTRVGPFTTEHAVTLEATPDEARTKILPAVAALPDRPVVRFTANEEVRFRCGQSIAFPAGWSSPTEPPHEAVVLDEHGGLLGVATIGRGFHPFVVLAK